MTNRIKCFIAIQFCLAPPLIAEEFFIEDNEKGTRIANTYFKLWKKVHPDFNKDFQLFIGEKRD